MDLKHLLMNLRKPNSLTTKDFLRGVKSLVDFLAVIQSLVSDIDLIQYTLNTFDPGYDNIIDSLI